MKKNNSSLRGLVTYAAKQSINALGAAKPHLTKKNIHFDLAKIKHKIKLWRFWVWLFNDFRVVLKLFMHPYDFLLLNPGSAMMQRYKLIRLLVFVAKRKNIPVYVRWGSCRMIHEKVKKRMGVKNWQKGVRAISDPYIKGHLTLTPFNANDLAEAVGLKDSIIIHNSKFIEEKFLHPSVPEEIPIVLNISSVQHRKGPDLFVEIAAKVCTIHPSVRFVWVGGFLSDSLKTTVNQLGLNDRILFVGGVYPPHEWVHKASCMLFTARSDAFPTALLDAMACHRTIVCFKGSGPEYVVGDTGIAVDQRDTSKAAQEVLKIINKPAAERINHKAFARYKKMFSPEAYANRLHNVVNEKNLVETLLSNKQANQA